MHYLLTVRVDQCFTYSLVGLINALDSSDTVSVTNNGVTVTMTNGMPKVYYVSHSSAVMADVAAAADDDDDDDDDEQQEEGDHDKSKWYI